ncbi:MAG: MFS transporter [Actinomycetota bacterium]|nr:MFS transporter [Actinomycetota bacterium]
MGVRQPRGLVAALGHRDFRRLMVAFAVSGAGSWAYNVALTVYVYDQTHSAAWASAVTIGRMVPSLVFGSYGGVVAERFERVRLMLNLDVVSTVLMALLTVLAALHGPAALAIAVGALVGTISMVYLPAVTAITPQIVPEADLAAANSIRSTVDNLVVIAGPAIGALLLAVGSPAAAFGANAASYAASALILRFVSARSAPVDVTEGGRVGPLRQMAVGMKTVLDSSAATLLVAYSVIASFVYGTDTVLFVIVSEHRLHAGANGYGELLAGLGVGGVLAAGIVNRIASWARLGPAILVGITLYCVPTLLLLVVPNALSAVPVEVVRGAGTLVVDVLAMTALQRSLPGERLARVFGAFFTLVLVAISLGALLTPVALHAVGLASTLWLAGAAIPALCLLGWPALSAMDRRNAAQLAVIAPRVALLYRAALFADAPQSVLERLAASAEEVSYGPGVDVIVEGDAADALYVIVAGSVAVSARRGGDASRPLATLGVGDVVGEIGILEGIARTATVTSAATVRLLRIDGPSFLDALVNSAPSPTLLGRAEARLGRELSLAATRPQPGGAPDAGLSPEPG